MALMFLPSVLITLSSFVSGGGSVASAECNLYAETFVNHNMYDVSTKNVVMYDHILDVNFTLTRTDVGEYSVKFREGKTGHYEIYYLNAHTSQTSLITEFDINNSYRGGLQIDQYSRFHVNESNNSSSTTREKWYFSFEYGDEDLYISNTFNKAYTSYSYSDFQSMYYDIDLNDYIDYFDMWFNLQSNTSYDDGYKVGFRDGKDSVSDTLYQDGYNQGYADGVSQDDAIFTIFNGILNVGLLPINVLLSMMNFEILGINVANFVTSLLTVAMVVIVIRIISGGKGGGDSGGGSN